MLPRQMGVSTDDCHCGFCKRETDQGYKEYSTIKKKYETYYKRSYLFLKRKQVIIKIS